MCTCIKLKKKDTYFGRNLDLQYDFGQEVVITPRNYLFKLRCNESFRTKYAIIGMATVEDNYPLYAEASNEAGLSIAGLYFPENAHYNEVKDDKFNLASFELIPYILGNLSNVEETKELLQNINIVNLSFKDTLPATELHWMISDRNKTIILEQTKDGVSVYDNPYEVLTNNPPFSYHLMNINNYLNLTPKYAINRFSNNTNLTACSNGCGSLGLPGDTSSPSRFIRAVFNKTNSVCNEDDEMSCVSQFFHLLSSVEMLKGSTYTEDEKCDYTRYSSCINIDQGIFYYKTYNNSCISAVKFNPENINSNELSIFQLDDKEKIIYLN